MDHRRIRITRAILTVCAALALVSPALPALAGDSDREARWQFSIPITWTSSESITGRNGSSLDVSDDAGWGFSFAYNPSEHWAFGADFTFLEANYDARIVTDSNSDGTPDGTERVTGRLDSSNFQITGQYNFLEKTVTPFVRASLGSTFVDSNIASGPPVGWCWWVPWWGYVCDGFVPTFNDTSFSYGAGAGVRADMSDRFYLEGSVNQLWIDVDGADTVDFTGYRLNIGGLF